METYIGGECLIIFWWKEWWKQYKIRPWPEKGDIVIVHTSLKVLDMHVRSTGCDRSSNWSCYFEGNPLWCPRSHGKSIRKQVVHWMQRSQTEEKLERIGQHMQITPTNTMSCCRNVSSRPVQHQNRASSKINLCMGKHAGIYYRGTYSFQIYWGGLYFYLQNPMNFMQKVLLGWYDKNTSIHLADVCAEYRETWLIEHSAILEDGKS